MSRKVTREIVAAFHAHKQRKIGNTETDGENIYLHGNKIATRNPVSGKVYISTAGWNTPTTRDRLKSLTDFPVYQKRGQLYIGQMEWDGEWIDAADPLNG